MKNGHRFLVLALAVLGLAACDETTEPKPTHDVLKVIIDDPVPPQPTVEVSPEDFILIKAEVPSADIRTACSPDGVSRTAFNINGNEIEVTFVRADYIVVLAHVKMRGVNGFLYGGEVEIILPEQIRVYNVMKNSELQARDTFGNFAFMGPLTSIALHERYTICAPQYPGSFWRPKDIPAPPRVPEINLP